MSVEQSPLAQQTVPPVPPAPRVRLVPWLPWAAFGLVAGAMTPNALSCATGIAWSPFTWAWGLGIPCLIGSWWSATRYPWAARWCLALATLIIGGAVGAGWQPPPPQPHMRVLAVTGMVHGVWQHPYSTGLLIEPHMVLAPTVYATNRRLFVRTSTIPAVAAGDVVTVRGRWQRGERGDELHASDVTVVTRREAGPRGWAWTALEQVGPQQELAQALLLGVGQPAEKDAFRQSGLLHVLAVSGAHLVIAAGLGVWCLRLLGLSWWWRTAALAVFMSGYTWLTDASPATTRALAMSLAVIAADWCARDVHPLGPVSLAALLLVCWDPSLAHDLGFQLSLAAVLGLVTMGRDLVRLRERWAPLQPWPLDRPTWRAGLWCGRSALDGCLYGIAASLATAPLIGWYFATFTPWAAFATVSATPPTTLALWSGLPCVVVAGWWPDGPWGGLYVLLELSLRCLSHIAAWWAAVPWATITVGVPPVTVIVLWPWLFLPLHDGYELLRRCGAWVIVLGVWFTR